MDFTINEGRRNLPVPLLVEADLLNNEGQLSTTGSLSVRTGKFTGRSPDDKFIVRDEITANTVDWGKINHPISEEHFNNILARMTLFISENKLGNTLYTFDGYVGADRTLRLPIRVITDKAWHCLFATQIFIKATRNELFNFRPQFTLLSLNDFASIPDLEGTNSDTFIIINFKKNLILMGSTSYAGEIKKINVFSHELFIT